MARLSHSHTTETIFRCTNTMVRGSGIRHANGLNRLEFVTIELPRWINVSMIAPLS